MELIPEDLHSPEYQPNVEDEEVPVSEPEAHETEHNEEMQGTSLVFNDDPVTEE